MSYWRCAGLVSSEGQIDDRVEIGDNGSHIESEGLERGLDPSV